MKKAKMILAAIAVFAVVGGVYASKASKFGAGNLWYTTTTTGGVITCLKEDFVTTAPNPLLTRKPVYTTSLCPVAAFTSTYITTTIL